MTFEQLEKYIDTGDEIKFRYHYPNDNKDDVYISPKNSFQNASNANNN